MIKENTMQSLCNAIFGVYKKGYTCSSPKNNFSSMCHIIYLSYSYSDGSVLKQSHQSKTSYKYI